MSALYYLAAFVTGGVCGVGVMALMYWTRYNDVVTEDEIIEMWAQSCNDVHVSTLKGFTRRLQERLAMF